MIEGVEAIVAGDGQETGRVQPLVESVGKGIPNPGETGLTGAVVKRKNEDETATGLAGLDIGGRPLSARAPGKAGSQEDGERERAESVDLQKPAPWRNRQHRLIICGRIVECQGWLTGVHFALTMRGKWRTAAHSPSRSACQTT